MPSIKFLAVTTLMMASLGLAACTSSSDVSGTAGQANQKSLYEFLQSLPPSQRLDFAYIEQNCRGCAEAPEFKEYIQALCDTEPEACTPELMAMLTKKRTRTQVRNNQSLVGLPTAKQLMVVAAPQFGAPPPSDADQPGSGAVEPKKPGGGASDPIKPGAGDPRAPGKGEWPVASAKAILNAMALIQEPAVRMEMLVEIAAKQGLGSQLREVQQFMERIAGGDPDLELSSNQKYVQVASSLLAGQSAQTQDLRELLRVISIGK